MRLCYQAGHRDTSIVVKYARRDAARSALCSKGLLSRPPSLGQSERRDGLSLIMNHALSTFEQGESVAIAC